MLPDEINAVLGDHVLRCHGGPTSGKANATCMFCIEQTVNGPTVMQVRVDVELVETK